MPRVATSANASAAGAALPPNISSASVLARLTAQPKFAQQFKQLPNYRAAVDLHLMLHDMLARQVPLRPAPTKVSDAQGVLLLHAAAGELKGWPLMVQTFTAAAPIDWVHHSFNVAPGFGYSKSSAFTAGGCLTPHLEMETSVVGNGSRLLLYINMDPRLPLELHPAYLEHYYNSAPPSSSNTTAGSSSWMQLEARAAASPGFSRFVSPSLHVRVFSASAILFWVDCTVDGLAAARRTVSDAVGIWLSWLAAGGSNSAASPAALQAAAGPGALPRNATQLQALLSDMAAFSAAWRNFPRREAAAPRMAKAFGADAMEAMYSTTAGSASVRLPVR
uniref:Red chlorophyll catabolite reductase n=1 Tax=Tetradesmus obliquus TaxID=3088 RepID=A0A383WEL1_TETOB|eukprot:jgi/Sobl393_1/9295/SZX75861.1